MFYVFKLCKMKSCVLVYLLWLIH